jgi:hypothetical protein
MIHRFPGQGFLITSIVCFLILCAPLVCLAAGAMSDTQIAQEIAKENNKVIIDEFLKYELGEVNEQVTKYLLSKHPSLEFFIKQAQRSPLKSLTFLEEQVHKLQDVQKNIDSVAYSIVFSSEEKQKIMGLKSSADKIISYGIPLMKRDFFKVIQAAKELAAKKHKHPMALIPDPAFRDAIYRQVESTADALDTEMGKLSEGELISMRLGWTLEQVRVTKLWLVINDNRLPHQDDYMVYRKKRSVYWENRLKRIYPQQPAAKAPTKKRTSR